MKSKLLVIAFLGYGAIAALAFVAGASPEMILFLSGPVIFALGIGLVVQELSWRRKSLVTDGIVARYHAYDGTIRDVNHATMYTLEAEYVTAEGKRVTAREQAGSNSKKYPEGTAIKIRYSSEDNSLFVIEGDVSRIIVMAIVAAFGLAVTGLFGLVILQG